MMSGSIPTAILSDGLHSKIRGRRVRVAVFTTFAFEPGFFEEEVLPILFEQSFSHVPRLRLVQLEEALRAVDDVAVYYDRRALVTGSSSAALDVRRIAMSRRTGFFHPKIILLLVEGKENAEPDALIVAVMSANLTRAGWWENVECAYMHEVVEGSRCRFRQDLLDLMRWIRRDEATGEAHTALEAIRGFLHYRIEDEPFRSAQGVMHSRIFMGAQSVASFLSDSLRLPRETYNLEVISPYFDNSTDTRTLKGLIDELAPRETRILLPQADDGAALCRKGFFEAVASLRGVKWGKLPRAVMQRAKSDETQPDRFVHAKVYRLWSRVEGREYLLIGSVNLTHAAHSKASAGNLEAAVLLDMGAGRSPSFWLEPIEDRPPIFRVEEAEEGSQDAETPPLSIRYFWDESRAEYFWARGEGRTPGYAIFASAGADVYRLEQIVFDEWTPLPDEVSERISILLHSTSFLEVKVEDKSASTVLIREEGMAHKPSILLSLTAEEILRYWSLLSPEQREAFLSDKAHALMVSESLAAQRANTPAAQDSLFDRFAGIFHAFSRLDEHVSSAIEQGRNAEAVYRLFGRKYDSLPSLIEKVLKEDESDLVNRYVTLLTAKQLLNRLKRKYADFFGEHRQEEKALQSSLSNIEQLREQFDFAGREEMERFFRWFERMFFHEMQPREQA
jgi:hypothetical protein